jgi:hypothetical protein
LGGEDTRPQERNRAQFSELRDIHQGVLLSLFVIGSRHE